MSDRIKEKIGEELYNQIIAKGIKPTEFDMVDGWIPKARFDEVTDKYKNEQGKTKTLETKLTDAEKLTKDNKDWKDKYTGLNTKYENDIKAKDDENKNITKRYSIEARLAKEGAKHTKLLMSEVDLEKLSIEGDNILGLDDVVKTLKTDYKDMFAEVKTKNKTKSTGEPGGGGEDPPPGDDDDFSFMDNL